MENSSRSESKGQGMRSGDVSGLVLEKYTNVLPHVLALLVFVTVSIAFIIPTTMFFKENSQRRSDITQNGLKEFERLLDSQLEKIQSTARLLEIDKDAKKFLEEIWEINDTNAQEYKNLSNTITNYLQNDFSFVDILDNDKKVFINSGIESRYGADLSNWPPVKNTNRESRFLGFGNVNNEIYLIVTSNIRISNGDSAIIVLGKSLNKELINRWSEYLKANFVVFNKEKILLHSFPEEMANIPQRYIFNADVNKKKLYEDKIYAIAKFPIDKYGIPELQVATFFSIESLNNQLEKVYYSMLAFVAPLLIFSFILVYKIAKSLQRRNVAFLNTNALLQKTNHQLETLLKGLNEMTQAQTKEMAMEGFLKSVDRALASCNLNGILIQVSFELKKENTYEDLDFLFQKGESGWQQVEGHSHLIDHDIQRDMPLCVRNDKIIFSIPAVGTAVGSFCVISLKDHSYHKEDLAVIQSHLRSLNVIGANMVLAERERSHLFELVRIAAQLSDALNSPLLVLKHSGEKLKLVISKGHRTFTEKEWETLTHHISRVNGGVESLMARSQVLSELRERGRGIEATKALFT